MTKRRIVCFTLVFALAAIAIAATAQIDPQQYLDHVKFLASEELKGRGTGTPELEKAAQYIARQFRAFGLESPGDKSYLQAFNVTTNARLGPGNRLRYTMRDQGKELKPESEFQPFNFSASQKVSGSVVFVGYGITAREYHYDDYATVDVKDKIVLLLRHEPQEWDEKSVFAGKVYTEHSQFPSKATNARIHGARAVILINDTPNHAGETDDFEKFGRTAGPRDAGIPFMQVRATVAEGWFAESGKNLKDIMADIDKLLKPQSFALPDSIRVELQTDVERDVRTVHNVAGYLRGFTDEYVVIGAHYDHIGLGEQYSMAPSQAGTPHYGADDNASGTAGVLELARWFSSQPKPKRGFLFLAFASEELGLLGSSHWVNHPELSMDKAVTMINMDMIGRIREGKVFVGGSGTGTGLKELLSEAKPKYKLNLEFSEQAGYGSSDHTSFTTKQVPVLFFFSGLHADYHKPSDTWEKIDPVQATQLLRLIADVAGQLSSGAPRPQFVRVAEPKPPMAGQAGARSYGADFGSVPDFTEMPKGVRFADVRPGSPAAKAGLKGGDVLIEFDGKPIQNLYDFSYALRSKKPGEEVLVKVLRGTETLAVKVLLGQRK